MKIMPYADVTATHIDNEIAKGLDARVVIGKADGAPHFCMRVFEVAPGGHTPKHSHDWEHEVFVHSGRGEILCGGRWNPVQAGYVAFIPGNEEHQIRNNGKEKAVLVCLVPSKAPEL